MGNMSYCRFRNTLRDLYDCYNALVRNEPDPEDDDDDELRAAKRLYEVCKEIVREVEAGNTVIEV